MSETLPDEHFDQVVQAALGVANPPNFAAWQAKYADAIARLTPAITFQQQRKRRFIMWATRVTGALAASILVILLLRTGGNNEALAQAITAVKAVEGAKTLTWTNNNYLRYFSKDGQRSWLKNDRSTMAYQRPGLYRDTRYDQDGNVRSVEIVDVEKNKVLFLNMKEKKAIWKNHSTNYYRAEVPSIGLGADKLLERHDIQFVGQRKVGDANANVFRYYMPRGENRESTDVWVDANTKQLLGYSSPGGDAFDPQTAADRNNPPEKTFSRSQIAGLIWDHIVVDAKLDDGLFSLTPPSGFEVSAEPQPPVVNETELLKYLRLAAEFNDGKFGDAEWSIDMKQFNLAEKKKSEDRTEIEQKMIDAVYEYMNNRFRPFREFAKDFTVPKSFRYVGEGVKFGDADRIVCWYKLKSTGKWRAVYGDLTVKDVEPKDLPLPVEK